MIRIEDVHKSFGAVKALDGLSLEVPAGKVFGLIGPNGAGKTTTIRILAGLIRPDAGGVLLNGILGDQYKSHGCMHVSPRNSVFLFELLPVGAQMKVYEYDQRISEEAVSQVPWLADLVNFEEDLEKMIDRLRLNRGV